jgi:hypothetical protein
MMDRNTIVGLVRRYLQNLRAESDLDIELIEEAVRQEGDWWYVPVRTDQEIKKRYRYYEELTDLEAEMKQREHVDVLLVPSA